MRKLTTLQATYTEYRDLYQMLIIDHDPDPEDLLESRLYELEHTLEDAGIRAVYDKNITSHDLQNIRIITDSDPNSGKMSLHFVPQNAGEKNAINWVMGKLMTTASINPPVVTFIADKFMDVEAALASQNQTASFTSRILIPSSSAISNPLMTALNVLQGEEERGARTTMDFIHSGLQNLAREISSSLDKAPHEASQIQFTDLQATEISTELQSLLTSDHVITPV